MPGSPAPCRRVLVVEDDPDQAYLLAALLRLTGAEVHVAHAAEQALALGAAHEPDAIVLDLVMPWGDGIETARRIRQEPWGRRPLLIALSGWDTDQAIALAKEAGCSGFLSKPIAVAHLASLLGLSMPPPASVTQAASFDALLKQIRPLLGPSADAFEQAVRAQWEVSANRDVMLNELAEHLGLLERR